MRDYTARQYNNLTYGCTYRIYGYFFAFSCENVSTVIKFFCILRARRLCAFACFNGVEIDETAVVTGGSSGIGLSCCRKFLENGYRVYELSRREPKIQTVGVKHISCDVTDEHSVSEAFKKYIMTAEALIYL